MSLRRPANKPGCLATVAYVTPANMIDGDLLSRTAREIVADMSNGACADTITQTVQVLDLGNGKKAALRITVTTDYENFL